VDSRSSTRTGRNPAWVGRRRAAWAAGAGQCGAGAGMVWNDTGPRWSGVTPPSGGRQTCPIRAIVSRFGQPVVTAGLTLGYRSTGRHANPGLCPAASTTAPCGNDSCFSRRKRAACGANPIDSSFRWLDPTINNPGGRGQSVRPGHVYTVVWSGGSVTPACAGVRPRLHQHH
jgi:hypothetical protein